MSFRKDCEECGRSFLTPDRKAKVCQRCAGKDYLKPQPKKVTGKTPPPGASLKPKKSGEQDSSSGPVEVSQSRMTKKPQTPGSPDRGTEGLRPPAPEVPLPIDQKASPLPADRRREPVVPTPEQIQEIVERYQTYVQALERPAAGRRKSIALALGLPHRSVVLALREWNRQQAYLQNVPREVLYAVEKSFFHYLESLNSFPEIAARISQETGLSLYEVSRYLDLLHEGEEKLRKVEEVSSEQAAAILEEYRSYLAGSGPPVPPLHSLIAERTGVLPKQVYKVLLAYRMSRLREKWG